MPVSEAANRGSWASSLRLLVDVHPFESGLTIWFYQFPPFQLTALHIFHARKTP